MARIRTLKPEFWKHERLSELPEATHMLAAALLNYADDEGYFNANPGLVKSECFPLREPSISIGESLQKLEEIGYLVLGSGVDGRRYGRIVTFPEHQVVNRPKPSKIKALGVVWDGAVSEHTHINDRSHPEGNREREKEWKGENPSRPEPAGSDLLGDQPIGPKEARARVITLDAIETYNSSGLVKSKGGQLASVSINVGREKRVAQVKRCIRTARDICKDRLGSDRITREFWEDYWDAVSADDFMAGRQKPGNGHANWKPDFEYLTREATMLKVFERLSETT